MSNRFIESSPCKAQAKLMKRLGFTTLDTEDPLDAVWQLGAQCILRLPAAFTPVDEADLMRRLATEIFRQGEASARATIRAALNGHA
ncbi:MAG: hypothetical protein V4662_12000 [Verrucomicrobiota bacterium]